MEDGTLEDATPLYFKKAGMQVNGYSYLEESGILNLFVCLYKGSSPPSNIRLNEVESAINRLLKFLTRTINGENNLAKGTPINDLILDIYEGKESLIKVNLYFLTDGVIKKKWTKKLPLSNVETEVHIWDLQRLFRNITSGENREAIEIDFSKLSGPIPCLEMVDKNKVYNSYLAIVPAKLLVEIYGKYGSRLLEGNIRSFLQVRGSVNKGIRNTLKNEPHMFLAYNNGISAVAEKAEIIKLETGGLVIGKVKDLQIVNGGQTTATLYHVFKNDQLTLNEVNIQVKLTVLSDPTKLAEIVPKISEYANSQNKIQGADFSSNHSYHRALEEHSRTVWAPVINGAQRQTKWYYERARGQFLLDIGKETTLTYKRNFDAEYPKSQKFDKTQLAKYINVWDQKPYLVSRGTQKNFNEFMNSINKSEKNLPVQSDFERIVALTILYRTAEQLIKEQKQSYPAYRSNIVAYSIAWISYVTDGEIDLQKIWASQKIPYTMKETLNYIFKHANSHITNAPGKGNITEWCKKKECWDTFIELNIEIPESILV
jgi:hypothetical protein